jgi:hypothetical protein
MNIPVVSWLVPDWLAIPMATHHGLPARRGLPPSRQSKTEVTNNGGVLSQKLSCQFKHYSVLIRFRVTYRVFPYQIPFIMEIAKINNQLPVVPIEA